LGEPRLIVTHEPGEFTGELANLTGRSSNIDAIAKGTTEVYEIREPDLRRIVGERPGLSDLILRALIIRAQTLSENKNFTGLRIIGARFSTGHMGRALCRRGEVVCLSTTPGLVCERRKWQASTC
jgi:CRP-like cAMP-binding protein